MKRTLATLGLILALGWGSLVWADAINMAVNTTTTARRTRTVFNNSGGALTSGTVVVWDNGASTREFDNNGYPYVTTTTTADSPWTAGVTLDASCADQTFCEIVVEGPAITRIAQSGDAVAVGTLVGTSATSAGTAGDYVPTANTCALGTQMRLREAYTGATPGNFGTSNNVPMWVFVEITCQ